MKCSEIIKVLNELAPESCACEWDNPGLIAGRRDKEVKKILVTLDATDEAVETAIREGADMLLSHHPLIFKPVKKINDEDFITKRILKLIQHDISYYAMHTNFDSAPGCMADLAADRLGLEDQYTEFLGNRVICHNIPIRPGRNLAVIVETAAINYRQKKMGYNAAQELYNRVQANLAAKRE